MWFVRLQDFFLVVMFLDAVTTGRARPAHVHPRPEFLPSCGENRICGFLIPTALGKAGERGQAAPGLSTPPFSKE